MANIPPQPPNKQGYQQPPHGYPPQPQYGAPQYYPPANPKSRLSGPATGLIISGIFNIIGGLVAVGYGLIIVFAASSFQEGIQNEIRRQNGPQTQQQEAAVNMGANFFKGYGFLLTAGGALSLVLGSLIIYGAMQMMKAQSFGFCIFAAAAAIIPMPGCWFLGIGMGIWALVVLNDENVKRVFR